MGRRHLPLLLACALLAPGALAQDQDAASRLRPIPDADSADTAAPDRAPEREATPPRATPEKPPPKKKDPALPKDWMDQFQWRSIGPANMGGRITAIAVYEKDPCIWWAATASGGLLKTTNNGRTFEHQFDREAVVSIGDVQVAQSDPNIVWVGTGESNPRNSVSWGNGVYKSTDGGDTWKHMGLERSFQIGRIAIHPENPDIVYVGALGRLWGPNEERGLYKTTDGGETWERILYVDENTGVIDVNMSPADPDTLLVATYHRRRDGFDGNDPAEKWGPGAAIYKTTDGGKTFKVVTEGLPTCQLGRIDIDYYKKDPNVVYATIESEKIGGQPKNAAYMGIQGESADVGARLTEIVEDSPAAKAGLKKGDIVIRFDGETVQSYPDLQRKIRRHLAGDTVSIEVSRDRESHTFEVTFDLYPDVKAEEEKEDQGEGEAEAGEEGQRSESGRGRRGGRNPRRSPFSGMLGGQVENAQDQQGPDGHEYGGVYRSDDGGETWTRVNSLNARPMYFSQIRVDPSDCNYVYSAGISLYRSKDGGKTFTGDGHRGGVHVDHHALWIDPNDGRHMILGNDGGIYVTYDRMESWDHLNHVAIGQFYHVTVGPRRNYMVYGGLQDNGSWGGPSRSRSGSGPVNEDWISIGGGDGFVCRVSREDPDLVYFESQNGGMGRRNIRTGDRGFLRPRAPRGKRYRFNWQTPFILSHHNPDVYYTAGNHVFRSMFRGDSLDEISPDITVTDKGSASALAESPFDPDRLWVGTTDGALWRTENGGHDWIDLWEFTPEKKKAPEAAEASSPDDPLSGSWKGAISNERFPDAGGDFSLDLKLAEDGAVTGSFDSPMSSGPIEDARFDAESNTLTFTLGEEPMFLDGKATLAEGKLSGTLSAGGGRFTMEFAAERTAPGAGDDEEPSETRPLRDLVPMRMWVSSIEPSRHERGRVYLALDGHRSDNDEPWIFVSEDSGGTWRSLRDNLPEGAGSSRVLREDIENENVLYLGTEFKAYVSIDRGETWTSMNSNLPTVAIHEFAQHPIAGEMAVATHGRSVWILDVTTIRQLTADTMARDAWLYRPNDAVYYDSEPRRGGTLRRFVGENPTDLARIHYHIRKDARRVSLQVKDLSGETLATLDASSDKGLHTAYWNLRGGDRRFRVEPGTYQVALTVDNETLTQPLKVLADPERPEIVLWGEEYERRLELERLFMGEDEGGDEER